jgi:hypothetical protein
MMTRPCALAGIAVLVGLLAAPAQATPILEQTLIATGGDVVVTFVSTGAGYTSELFLDGAVGDELGAIFNNWTTDLGSSVNLGSFAAGTELVFKLLVQQTGDAFYTGGGSRNLDGLVHAALENVAGQVLVGFEDLYGGGDLDYDDLVFAFVNVAAGGGDSPGNGSGGTTGSPAAPGAGGSPIDAGGSPIGAGGGPIGGGPGAPRAVDEPGTLVLLGSGLVMLGVAMKRQAARR